MLRVGALGAAVVMTLALAQGASSAVMIGNASTVVREVRSTLETRERILIVNDDVFQDEEVTTGELSAARLIFKDGTNMAMGAQSRLKLTRVLFDPDPSKSKVAMRAALGVFRMATGNLPSSAYQVATPVATISVRGTIIEVTVTGIGTTTVYVAQGAATVRSNNGDEVELEAGQSTTVRAEGVGDNIIAGSPTDPEAPSEEFSKQMRAMTVTLRSDEPPTDMLPGGGFFRWQQASNPFPYRPPSTGPGYGGGGGGGGGTGLGSPGGGGSTGSGSSGNGGNGGNTGGNGNSGGNNGGTGNDGGGTGNDGGGDPPPPPQPTVKTKVDIPNDFTRVGSTSDVLVTISRTDSGLGEIIGTLAGSSGLFEGPGSGENGLRLLAGGEMQFVYVFSPTQPGTFTTILPYEFPDHGISGTVTLLGQAIYPTLTVETSNTGGGGGGIAAQAMRTSGASNSVRISNDSPDVAPIDIVGVTILSAYVQGAGSEFLTISGFEPYMVLGAGDELIITVAFDPSKGATLEEFLELAALDEIVLFLQTDLNAAFGSVGKLLEYKLSFVDEDNVVVEIAAPPVGLVLVFGGALFLFTWRERQRR
jgi:hypothetical protein